MIDIISLLSRNRSGEAVGLPCFCTANEQVLRAVLEFCAPYDFPVIIEATCNQINQEGGYTGMSAADFAGWIASLSDEYGVPDKRVVWVAIIWDQIHGDTYRQSKL